MARRPRSHRRSFNGATRIVGTGRLLPHLGSGHRLRRPRSMPPARSQPSAVSADAGDDRLVRFRALPPLVSPRPRCLLQMGANDRACSWWLAGHPEDRERPALAGGLGISHLSDGSSPGGLAAGRCHGSRCAECIEPVPLCLWKKRIPCRGGRCPPAGTRGSPPKANAGERYRRQRDRSVTAGTPNTQLQPVGADVVAAGGEEVLPMTARRFREPSGLVNRGAAITSSMWHV